MDASNLILIGRDIERRSTFLQILQARHFEIALTCDDLSGLLAYDIETCPALCILVVDVEELAVQLDELAAATQRSRSFVAERAITAYIDHELLIVRKILEGIEDARAGRTVPHEEVMERMEEIILQAEARQAGSAA